MLLLPTFHARLKPCPVGPSEFTPHPQGNFCGQCQRVVHDFRHSTNPHADLAAARAAAPDGRVCGSFGRAQLATPPQPRLPRRLRWFVAALVLVVGQGLTAREALAQVRRATPHRPAPTHRKQLPVPEAREELAATDGIVIAEPPLAPDDTTTLRTSAEVMPTLRGRDYRGIVDYIQQQVRWPEGSGRIDAEGRVFVRFTVGTDGLVHGAEVLKGIQPLLDAEALRAVQTLPGFTPGRQHGRPVPVSLTVPVIFQRK